MSRSNEMTAEEWLGRILDSGLITRVTQHLALVIFALAVRQQQNGVSASVRDLERITGWSKSMIADHLEELGDFIKKTPGAGRQKSVFELQALVEDAVKAMFMPLVSANARTQAQESVRQCADAIPDTKPSVRPSEDAIPDANPDAKFSVRALTDAIPDTTKERSPPTPPSKENNKYTHKGGASASVPVSPAGPPGYTQLGHGAWLNCEKIWHPNFNISFPAVEMQLALNVDTKGLDCQTICKSAALQWAAAIEGGQNPREVVPQNVVGAIVGGARRGVYSGLEHKARIAATGGRKPFKPSRW